MSNEIVLNKESKLYKSNGLFKDFKEVKFVFNKEIVLFECLNKNNEYVYLNDVIDKDNISLYYEFMSEKDLVKYENILFHKFINRMSLVQLPLKLNPKQLRENCCYNNSLSTIFGTKDTLKPIEEYIEEIKQSEAYKEYIAKKS